MAKKEEKVEAIEIRDLADWEMLCVLQPSMKETWPSETIGSFFVVTPGDLEGAIIPPTAIENNFKCIEPNTRKLKFVKLVREVSDGEILPRRRRIAYRQYHRD